MLYEHLREIKDGRRGQGRRYDLAGILVCSILALMSDAHSYRRIHSFIKKHFIKLKETFDLKWKKPPSYTGLRKIIQGVEVRVLEDTFRKYSKALAEKTDSPCYALACDGKTLRGSFDHMSDQRAAQLLSVFAHEEQLILSHIDVGEKSNEIPAFQQLLEELNLEGQLFTLDAMHTQKKQ